MYTVFSDKNEHQITDGNINFYLNPFIYPTRNIPEHDFVYILQGEWNIGQNGEIYKVKKDDIVLLCANTTHYGVAPSQPNTKAMYFHATCENDFSYSQPPQEGNYVKSHINASINTNLKKYFREIISAKLQGNQKKANMFFKIFLYEIYDTETYSESKNIALRIKNIIHNSPEKIFTNSELAKMCEVSVKTAENKFKETFGTTIHQYVLNFKIEEAIVYFSRFEEMTIKEISYNLGFYDEYHFSKQFKKIMKTSPLTYKKNLINETNSKFAKNNLLPND